MAAVGWAGGERAPDADTARPGTESSIASGGSVGPDPASGEIHYLQSCANCHGVAGQGMPRQGPGLRDSAFVRNTADPALLAFLKVGRMPNDRSSTMRLYMPPRGGNGALTDADLADIVAHLRALQAPATPAGQATARLSPARAPTP